MGAREVKAGGAYVSISTKDETDKGLAGIKAKLNSLGITAGRIGGLAVGAAAAATARAISTGSAVKDMADRFGLSYEAVQQLGFVADQTGSSIETLAQGIKKMQQGLGNGTIAKELEGIGLSLADLRGKAPQQQFAMIAAAIGKISDPAKKTAAAMAIFGKAGSELVPLTGEVGKLMDEFDALGITMGNDAVEEAESLGDELDKLGKKLDAVVVKIGGSLMPTLEKLANVVDRLASPKLRTKADGNLDWASTRTQRLAGLTKQERLAMEWKANLQDEGGYDASASPINQFIANLGARAGRLNKSAADRDQAATFKSGLDVFKGVAKEWERIGRNVDRDQNKERIRERRQLETDLADVNKQIAAEMDRKTSYGSFDKRDLLGGVFTDIQRSQLKELQEMRKLLERQLAKKGGLPVGT